jgi:endonuclease/exonuclease/phosphatase family metal-dependent hydrolase
MARSGSRDQPAELAAATGLSHSIFTATLRRAGGEYGILVLSALPILARRDIALPRGGRQEPRRAQFLELEIAGVRICLVNTHLAVDPGQARPQLEVLAAAVAGVGQPCVLAGDLNGQPVPSAFMEDDRPTWPVERPHSRLDHLAVSGDFPFGVSWSTVCRPDLTDHCLVLAQLGDAAD